MSSYSNLYLTMGMLTLKCDSVRRKPAVYYPKFDLQQLQHRRLYECKALFRVLPSCSRITFQTFIYRWEADSEICLVELGMEPQVYHSQQRKFPSPSFL